MRDSGRTSSCPRPDMRMNSARIAVLLLGLQLGTLLPLAPSAASGSNLSFVALQDTPTEQEAPGGERRGQGLPIRTPPPRTLHDFWPMFVVFAATWLVIAGYTLTFNRRLRKVTRALGELEPAERGGES